MNVYIHNNHYFMASRKYITITLIAVTILNCVTVWFLWRMPWLVFALTFTGGAILLRLFHDFRIIAVYLLTAVAMTATEILAVTIGIWTYTMPTFYGVPVFLLSVWGNIGIIATSMYKLARNITHEKMPRARTHNELYAQVTWLLIFGGISLSVLVFAWHDIALATILLIGIKIAQIVKMHHMEHKAATILFLSTILGGAIVGEITSVALGVWHYNTDTIFGLPLFIYFSWGSTGLIIAETYTILSSPLVMRWWQRSAKHSLIQH